MKNLVFVVAYISLFGCASEGLVETQPVVQDEPIVVDDTRNFNGFRNEFRHKPESFSIDAQKNALIKTKNGSRIHISKNSFVDAAGKKVKGKVNFEVMEFNTHGEIIASNIPMVYQNEQGENEQFKSAGMFSLTASQNDTTLKLDSGKKIKVEYATDVDGSFNFYKLKSDSSNWEIKAENLLPEANSYLEAAQEKLDIARQNQPAPAKKPLAASDGDQLFDLLTFQNALDFNREFNGLMWKYLGDNPNLNPAVNPGKYAEKHSLMGIAPLDTNFLAFSLTIRNVKTKDTFQLEAAPIHKGALLDRGERKYQETIAKIEQSAREQNAIIREMANEKELLRIFEVDELGVFNYDVKYMDNNNIPFAANFTFDGKNEDNVNVYLLPTEQRIVVKFTPSTFNEFSINPKNTNRLVAILPNKDVYLLSNRDILSMNLRNIPRNSKITFDLKKVNRTIDTPQDLDKAINALV